MTRKSEKRKIHLSFINTILGTGLADMPILRKFNKEFQFQLCVIDISSKYDWVVPLKDKKGITITQNILDESNHKPNKIWINKSGDSYNRSIKLWLQDYKIMATRNRFNTF